MIRPFDLRSTDMSLMKVKRETDFEGRIKNSSVEYKLIIDITRLKFCISDTRSLRLQKTHKCRSNQKNYKGQNKVRS